MLLKTLDPGLTEILLTEINHQWEKKERAVLEATQLKPQHTIPTWKPEPKSPAPENSEDTDVESTLEYDLEGRLDCMISFMKTDGRRNYTREQLEIGAGYRRANERLPQDEYKKLKRRIQLDIAYLVKNGHIIHEEKDQPKGMKGGFKNKIHLYSLAYDPDADTDEVQLISSLRSRVLAALDALDTRDMDKFIDLLQGALDALDIEN
jgi:hypothetical protein